MKNIQSIIQSFKFQVYEVLSRICEPYAIEDEIRGQSIDVREHKKTIGLPHLLKQVG